MGTFEHDIGQHQGVQVFLYGTAADRGVQVGEVYCGQAMLVEGILDIRVLNYDILLF